MRNQVFISSPVESLKVQREIIRDTLEKLGYKKIFLSESEGSKNKSSFQTCMDEIGKSCLFILLLGKYYGWIPENEEHSVTELEYNEACNQKIDILVYKLDFFDYEEMQRMFIEKVEDFINGKFRGKPIENKYELENRILSDVHQLYVDKTDANKKIPDLDYKYSEQVIKYNESKEFIIEDILELNDKPLLLIKARINYSHEAGNAQLLKLHFNGYELVECDLVNKQKTIILNNGRIHPCYNLNTKTWNLPYSPNFRDNYFDIKYKVINGDAYTYIFSLKNATLKEKNNVLKISHFGTEEYEAYKNSIIIGKFELIN